MKREIIDASQLELVDQVVDIKRVTKVVKGGRNMRFTALVVVGDKNGHVGAGLGKAAEIPEAIRKGKEDAIKSLISVKLDENNSITHDVTGKYTGASVLKVLVSSLVVQLVPYVSLPESLTSVPSLWDLTISRTLYLLQSRHFLSLEAQKKLQSFAASP